MKAKTCINCKHAIVEVFESGQIDCVDYRCPFQDNKFIYSDNNVFAEHFCDVPECKIGKFEERK